MNQILDTEITSQQVAEIVRQYTEGRVVQILRNKPESDVTLTVDETGIKRVNGWWRVPVYPSQWPERMSPLYEELAIIEEEMRDDKHLDVLLSAGAPVNAG